MKVFISYAREDIGIAEKLYNDLKKAGAAPWMDEYDLLPGQDRRAIILHEIRQSKYFIVVLSSKSLSEIGLVQKEMKTALEILDEFPADGIFVIPARIDDLNRYLKKFQKEPGLSAAMKRIIAGKGCSDVRMAERLESAGLVRRDENQNVVCFCGL